MLGHILCEVDQRRPKSARIRHQNWPEASTGCVAHMSIELGTRDIDQHVARTRGQVLPGSSAKSGPMSARVGPPGEAERCDCLGALQCVLCVVVCGVGGAGGRLAWPCARLSLLVPRRRVCGARACRLRVRVAVGVAGGSYRAYPWCTGHPWAKPDAHPEALALQADQTKIDSGLLFWSFKALLNNIVGDMRLGWGSLVRRTIQKAGGACDSP